MKEINPSKSPRDNGIDNLLNSLESDLSLAADMWEYVTFTHLDESKFGIITVGRIIWGPLA